MSGSVHEVQVLADQILELLGVRIPCGQLVIHFADGRVQRCETNTVHKPKPRAMRKDSLDNESIERAR
jgi:hypothetical protein